MFGLLVGEIAGLVFLLNLYLHIRLDLLKALTPDQAASLLKGDFSARIFFNLVARNPSLVRTFMKYSLQALLPGKEEKAEPKRASVVPSPAEGA